MSIRTVRGRFVLACLIAVPAVSRGDQDLNREEYIRAHYSKYEYRIPMRDGQRLFTSVYVPNDAARTYPLLLFRTPYSVAPYGADRYRSRLGPTEEFEQEGFIFVFQDVRGRFMSEGQFVNMRPHIPHKSGGQVDESSDTYDTIAWLLENVAGHNGKVGQWGISYPGFYTSAGAIDSHPALRAISPQAPIADWFWDDMHRNGAFVLSLTFNFFSRFGVERDGVTTKWPDTFDHGTPDGYQFFLELGPLRNVNDKYFKGDIAFWNEVAAHPNYDEFWKSRNILPHLKNIKAATLVVGGWFDTEDLYGPLKTYAAIERQNEGVANSLVMGPWSHGQWSGDDGQRLGSADWGFATSDYFRDEIQLPFFLHHLKDGEPPALAEAIVFETGANRWRRFDAWPPSARREKSLYLHAGGRLAFDPPTAAGEAHDEYLSDPSKPVPNTMEIMNGWSRNYMTADQRFAAWRPDVLVYRTEPLEEDVTLAGPLAADLWVSTTGTAADWVVKLVDVYPGELPGISNEDAEEAEARQYPGGRQMLVRANVMRGRFRESFERPKAFTPHEVTPVSFELRDVLHRFQRGHRIMIQIQSTWFPFIDRNPQTWVSNIFEAREVDFVKALHRVHRSQLHPSRIRVGVLP
jgi:putative CocE/NonD family hydrolase